MDVTDRANIPTSKLPGPNYAIGTQRLHKLLGIVLSNPLGMWTAEHFERPIVAAKSPIGTRVVVSDPVEIKRILVDHADNYVRDTIQQRILLRTTGNSLFTAAGEDWKIQRKALAPIFSARAIQLHLGGMIEAAGALVERLRNAGDAGFDVAHEMHATAIDVLGRTILRGLIDDPPGIVARNVRRFADIAGAIRLGDLLNLPGWVPGLKSFTERREITSVAARTRCILTKARRLQEKQLLLPGIISALTDARDPETDKPIEERIIEDSVSMFVGAGSDTAALALAWSLYLLSVHPDALSHLEAEIVEVLGAGPVTPDALGRLHWTRAVIEEAMRLYPPVPMIVRSMANPDFIAGREYAAGTLILIAPWVLHRHKSLWRKPDEFDPSRFMPGEREQITRFAYLPFGAGPRTCIGTLFSMQEAIVVLATVVRALRLERIDDKPILLRAYLTLQPIEEIRMRARARLPGGD